MKRIRIVILSILAICCLPFLSYSQVSSKLLGCNLGETSINDAVSILSRNYRVSRVISDAAGSFGQTQLMIRNVQFAGITWDHVNLLFSRYGKLQAIEFRSLELIKNKPLGKSLYDNLVSKYNNYIVEKGSTSYSYIKDEDKLWKCVIEDSRTRIEYRSYGNLIYEVIDPNPNTKATIKKEEL